MNSIRIQILALPFVLCSFLVCQATAEIKLNVSNVSEHDVRRGYGIIQIDRLPEAYQVKSLRLFKESGDPVISQVDDMDRDGTPDELVFQLSLQSGESTTLRLEKGSPGSFVSDLQVPDNWTVLRNGFLRVDVNPREYLGIIMVRDRTSGNYLLENLHLSNDLNQIGKANPETTVISRGPVRSIIQQQSINDPDNPIFELTQRYVMYNMDNGFHYQFDVKNVTHATQQLEFYNRGQITDTYRDVIKGKMGTAFTRNYKKTVDQRGVRLFRTSRKNILYFNKPNNRSLGVTFYHPYWWFIDRIVWAPPEFDFNGIVNLNARNRPEIFFGKIFDYPGDPSDWEFRSFKHTKPSFDLDPGETRKFGMSFRVYKEDRKQTLNRFSKEVETSLGVFNVLSQNGRVLGVANAPIYLEESFEQDRPNRWVTHGGATLNVDEGTAVIQSGEAEGGIRTALSRDFIDPTRIKGHVAELAEGTSIKIRLTDVSTGRTLPVATISGTGDFRIRTNKNLPLVGLREVALSISLVGDDTPLRAELDRIELSWPDPRPVRVKDPKDDAALNNFSVRVNSRTPGRIDRGWILQIARDEQFDDVVLEQTTANWWHPQKFRAGRQTIVPDEPLDPGTYYFRLRTVGVLFDRSPWTKVRRFTIQSE